MGQTSFKVSRLPFRATSAISFFCSQSYFSTSCDGPRKISFLQGHWEYYNGFQEHISSGVTGGNVCFGDDERNCVILQNDIMWGTVFPYFGRDCTRLCSVERSHVVHVVYALSTAIRFRELGTNSLTRRQAEKTCQSKSGHSGGWDDGTWIRYLLYVR